MSLNATACAQAINDEYQITITFPRDGDYPSDFADVYDAYAAQGVVTGAINTGGDKAIVEAAVRAAQTTPAALGAAFAAYWATVAIDPAPPNLSVVNDAAALESVFIQAVADSVRDTESVPYFQEFISNLETAAKSVTWTITPPAPGAPFTSGIT